MRFEIKGTKAYIRCVFDGEWKYFFHHGASSSEIDEGTMLAFAAHELISSGAQDYLSKAAGVYKKQI